MIYLFTKDSTLLAFEGPERPQVVEVTNKFDWGVKTMLKEKWDAAMSTARESALPVMNAEEIVNTQTWPDGHYTGTCYFHHPDQIGKAYIKPGETVPLPGWALEKVHQIKANTGEDANWIEVPESHAKGNPGFFNREAYRLVRSGPVKKEPIKLTFYSGKLWNSDKPFNKGCSYESKIYCGGADCLHEGCGFLRDWLSTAYEVVNPEVIQGIYEYDGSVYYLSQEEMPKELKDGDEITLPEGYGIETIGLDSTGNSNCSDGDVVREVATITLPEKPENSAHGYLTKAIAEMELEKIVGNISDYDHCRPKDVSDEAWTYAHRNYGGTKESCYVMAVAAYSYDRGKMIEPSESQEEIAGIVTKGQFIDLTTVAKQAHSEGKKEGWNEALDKILDEVIEPVYPYTADTKVLFEQIKKLRK